MPELRITVSEPMDKILESLVQAGLGSTKAEVARLAVAQMLLSMPDAFKRSVGPEIGISPEGRLPQFDNAVEATKKGLFFAGAVARDGVVLVKLLPTPAGGVDRITAGIIKNPGSRSRPIHWMTKSTAVAFTGYAGDGQYVLKEATARLDVGSNNPDVDVYRVGETIASIMHAHAMDRNSRVLGISLIVAGLDSDGVPRLLLIDPMGGLFDLKVASSGNMSGKAFAMMIDAVDEKDLDLEDAVKVSISASLLDGAIHQNLMVDVLDVKTRTFRELSLEEKRRYM
jgi:20S proteasome alpha/beta subunit